MIIKFKILIAAQVFLVSISVILLFFNYNLLAAMAFLLLVSAALYSFYIHIKKPLVTIVDALNANSPEKLIYMGLQPDEFGKIARFLMEFFHQRKLIHDKLLELNKANDDMEKLNNELITANSEVQNQKFILENKSKEINESIAYSSVIQSAVLSVPTIFSYTFPENFIYFKPRNILSGDFYWIKENNGLYFIVGADCTGHGLAGALLSMMGISFLNNILFSNNCYSASEILNLLRSRMIQALDQKGEFGEAHGGMDLVLCIIDKENKELEFAGAYNPLYIVRAVDGDSAPVLEEFKGNNMPVGLHINTEPFTSTKVKLNRGDMIYILTDGYGDQFGGELNKKYNTKKLKNLLVSVASENTSNQMKMIDQELTKWSEGYEQTDDILIMGIRF